MIELFKSWYVRRFSDPQAMTLAAILLFGFVAIYFFSGLIAPLLIAIVLSYLLEIPINFLNQRFKIPRLLAIALILGGFVTIVFAVLLGLLPNLVNQMVNLFRDLPNYFNKLHAWVATLPENYPELVDYKLIESILGSAREKVVTFGESAVKFSLASIMNLVSLGIYAFLVPLMMFFMLKDKDTLLNSVVHFLPQNRKLASHVWSEMQQQIANYIRGKLFEIAIVTIMTYGIFLFFGLNYPLLLSVAVGISVLVPYVGAVLVAIPVTFVALGQFGADSTFWSLIIAYVVSQLLDGNVVVPYLFSEAVNLHPLTIIVAVLIFGGLWGFWGVFFAIPLATLVKAVINAWPDSESESA